MSSRRRPLYKDIRGYAVGSRERLGTYPHSINALQYSMVYTIVKMACTAIFGFWVCFSGAPIENGLCIPRYAAAELHIPPRVRECVVCVVCEKGVSEWR